jgi:hypothetical protein
LLVSSIRIAEHRKKQEITENKHKHKSSKYVTSFKDTFVVFCCYLSSRLYIDDNVSEKHVGFCPEDAGSMFHRNIGIDLQIYRALQPRTPALASTNAGASDLVQADFHTKYKIQVKAGKLL